MDHEQQEPFTRAAALFKALGSPIRLAMLVAISDGPRCVHDLVGITGASQPLVSQHLRVLRQAHLLDAERVGRDSVYRLADEHVAHIVQDALVHVGEQLPRTKGPS